MNTFIETNLKKEILDALDDIGFIKPTPIQSKTIPYYLDWQKMIYLHRKRIPDLFKLI